MLDPKNPCLPPPATSHQPSTLLPPTGPTPPGNVTSPLPAPPGSAPLDGLLGIGHNAPSPAQDPQKPVFADPPLLLSQMPWKKLAKQVETLQSLPAAEREELLPPGYRVQLQASPVVPELLRTITAVSAASAIPTLASREQLTQVIKDAGDKSARANGGKPQLIIGETHYSAAELATTEIVAKLCNKYKIETVCVENSEWNYAAARDYIPELADALGIDPNSLNTEAGRRTACQLALQKKHLDPPILYELLNTILRAKIFDSMGIKVAHIDRLGPDDPQRDAAMAKNIDQVRQNEGGAVVLCGARHAVHLQYLLGNPSYPPFSNVDIFADKLPFHPSKFMYEFENSEITPSLAETAREIANDAKKFGVKTQIWRVPGNFVD